jgi:hypothetical protein
MKAPVQSRSTAPHSRGGSNSDAFNGAHEPTFESKLPYWKAGKLISALELERFKLRAWRSFREHTSHWPIFSICFHYGSYAAMVAGLALFFQLATKRGWSGFEFWIRFGLGLVFWVAADEFGARAARKLDWKLFGKS